MNTAETLCWMLASSDMEGIIQEVVDGKRTKQSAIAELAKVPMVSPFEDKVGHRLYVEANRAITRLLNSR